MAEPEVTFTVHPRPQSDDPRAVAAMAPILAQAEPPPAELERLVREKDTLIGDLVFLARFAFGRY